MKKSNEFLNKNYFKIIKWAIVVIQCIIYIAAKCIAKGEYRYFVLNHNSQTIYFEFIPINIVLAVISAVISLFYICYVLRKDRRFNLSIVFSIAVILMPLLIPVEMVAWNFKFHSLYTVFFALIRRV